MKQLVKILGTAPAAVMLALFMSAPAYATDHKVTVSTSSDTTTSIATPVDSTSDTKNIDTAQATTSTSNGDTEHSGSTEVTTSTDKTTEANTENSNENSAARSKGEQTVADLKKNHKEHTAAVRQNFCNLHKDNLQGRFHGLTTSAQAIQTNITGIYTKVQAFKTGANLTVTNYDTLVAAAATAQATSAADIASLTPLTLDCTSPTVATDVATFKASAEQVRSDLKAYRDAVKNLIRAVQAAATATSTDSSTKTTTTGTQGANQ